MLFLQVNEGLEQALRRLAEAQEVVSTGRRLNRLSDDPGGALRALDLRGVERSLDQYERNIDQGRLFLEETDQVLGQVGEILQRAKELALALANDTQTAQDRQGAATEVRELRSRLLSLANTLVAGRYLFGGFRNGSAPFAGGLGGVTYSGDGGEISIPVSASANTALNLPGNRVFQGTEIPEGVGLFDVLFDLEVVLNANNDPNGMRALSLAVNLDATAAAGSTPPFPPGPDDTPGAWQAASHFSTTVTVFDPLGEAHPLTFFFRHSAANTWEYRVLANRKELDASAPSGTDLRLVGSGTLVFTGGSLDTGSSTLSNITLTGLVNGADDIVIDAASLSFAGSTEQPQPFEVLTLSQTDTNGIQAQIGRLGAAIGQVALLRAEVGSRMGSVEAAREGLDAMKLQTTRLRAQIEEADALEAFSELARLQRAFEAALQSASRVIQPSLLDFIR